MRLIGDMHGEIEQYKEIIKGQGESIQVGDFGVGFIPLQELLTLDEEEPYHRFYRGNHDDPVMSVKLKRHINSGVYQPGVFVVGGAWSIDWRNRTPEFDWWADEQHSTPYLNSLLKAYELVKPHTVLTHDCPTLVAYQLFLRGSIGKAIYLNRTAETLQRMFEVHQPERWFFGHWHETSSITLEGTNFTCVGASEFIDVDW